MKIKKRIKTLLVCLLPLLTNVIPLKAEPQNFMVGSHVFARPDSWTWTDLPPKATISAKLIVNDPANRTAADVVFVESKAGSGWASADETIGRWEKNFVEPREKQHQRREERQFAKVKLTFFWQEGTYTTVSSGGGSVPHSGFAQYGVIIDDRKNIVLARILGDRSAVDKAKVEFKKMIESAVADQE